MFVRSKHELQALGLKYTPNKSPGLSRQCKHSETRTAHQSTSHDARAPGVNSYSCTHETFSGRVWKWFAFLFHSMCRGAVGNYTPLKTSTCLTFPTYHMKMVTIRKNNLKRVSSFCNMFQMVMLFELFN